MGLVINKLTPNGGNEVKPTVLKMLITVWQCKQVYGFGNRDLCRLERKKLIFTYEKSSPMLLTIRPMVCTARYGHASHVKNGIPRLSENEII